ncbi:MAG TPA: adenosylhomocysteinase [Candidatus Saccharimonadia bacterium]|nr:adenosylhomocysteinase [Candidatus Saccharimonadia bacterium]
MAKTASKTSSKLVPHDVKNLTLADKGKLKIEWAGKSMPVLKLLEQRFTKEKPLRGYKLAACLHVTAETANLMLTLKAGGAELVLCASNPLSTQDDVAAALVQHYKIPTYAIKGEDSKTYYSHLNAALDFHPNITMDDGADLVSVLHKERRKQLPEIIGSNEETTTGVIRLAAMAKDGALKIPVFAVNDSNTKHMFDNRYGTGQSTLDGILRATNILLAGKNIVVCGYGWCGRGLASRARGMGGQVIVTEVDPTKALEAHMDGFQVMRIKDASKIGDLFVTVTGDKNVISWENIASMKEGAILSNSGHFNVEIDLVSLSKKAKSHRTMRDFVEEFTLADGSHRYVLAEGRLINLAAAEGHPAEVMDMSFANQALAAEFFVENKGKLDVKVYRISEKMDSEIARLKLESLGVKIDKLTPEQAKYLSSWQEGT